MPKCLALFSGGQDSTLAIKILKDLGVEVIALNFVSHFFGGPSPRLDFMAKQLDIPVVFVPFEEQQLAITLTPANGRGKNFNACIDCHGAMLRIAGNLLPKYGADFIATGEVLGQRPMSQNAKALRVVQALSLCGDKIVRPLSGRLLEDVPAFARFFPKDVLLDVSGRGTTRQEALAAKYQLQKMPSHGGGCLLTDPGFAAKMHSLFNDQVCSATTQFVYRALRLGRMLRAGPGKYAIVGRDEASNNALEAFRGFGCVVESVTPSVEGALPGPLVLLLDFSSVIGGVLQFEELVVPNDIEEIGKGCCGFCGDLKPFSQEVTHFEASEDLIQFGMKAFSVYCKGKGTADTLCQMGEKIIKVLAVGKEAAEEVKKCLIE